MTAPIPNPSGIVTPGTDAATRAKRPPHRFTAEEIDVLRTRRRYHPARELAAVFGTTTHVVAALCRGVREA